MKPIRLSLLLIAGACAAAVLHSDEPQANLPPEIQAQVQAFSGKSSERVAAIEKLAEMGVKAAPAIPALIAELRYHGLESMKVGNQDILAFDLSSHAAARVLARLGPAAVAPLRVNLLRRDGPESHVHWTAVALAQMEDPAAAQILLQTLADPAFPARGEIAGALQFSKDPKAIEVMFGLARDPDPALRKGVLQGLQESKHPQCVPVLIEGLRDENREVRQAAAGSLLRQAAPASLDALLAALKDPDALVRNLCAQALGEIKDRRAIEPLIAVVVHDKEDLVQFQAGRALESITGQSYGQKGAAWQKWWAKQK